MGSGHGSLAGSGDGSLAGSLSSNSGSGDEEEEDESRVTVAFSPMFGGAIRTTASAACRSMISSTCCTVKFNCLMQTQTNQLICDLLWRLGRGLGLLRLRRQWPVVEAWLPVHALLVGGHGTARLEELLTLERGSGVVAKNT